MHYTDEAGNAIGASQTQMMSMETTVADRPATLSTLSSRMWRGYHRVESV